ncbi:MAG: ThuA domain-containing protein [Verrucomicrobia bacterium]|nr:ThuA domain-containing protein [Verrucomicrobiota bacterium]
MNRREMITRSGAAALGLSLTSFLGCSTPSASLQRKKILFFTKSAGFEHSAIRRGKGGEPSPAEAVLTELGPKHGFDITFSKDGSLFTPQYLAGFDTFFFYTTGDLTTAGTDKNPPMTPEGKQAFLDAIKNGKGYVGSHSASDTFHTGESGGGNPTERGGRYKNYGDAADPYIKMLGGEFIKHGKQQNSVMRVVDPNFPGFAKLGGKFELTEEWYSLKDFASNLHVLLVQETAGMEGNVYKRAPYPATWARMHGHGRVFYTSMGHREDVWTNPIFQDIVVAALGWATGRVNVPIPPNLQAAAPGYAEIPPQDPPAAPKKAAPKKK